MELPNDPCHGIALFYGANTYQVSRIYPQSLLIDTPLSGKYTKGERQRLVKETVLGTRIPTGR